eukprot:NODE_1960_length_1736_cov_53.425914_g1669_i0.p1 GENE.NODE_1960_length_1736_cov_53.425914_g1669_i0~~NODE_1960_length_1736_cov_53.425914_g1669_i0.p1  ORF type:complete len:529 (+),score=30.64 NODE_1960_length_1736_cov_53.425914_g1669_i0:57-1643(+)
MIYRSSSNPTSFEIKEIHCPTNCSESLTKSGTQINGLPGRGLSSSSFLQTETGNLGVFSMYVLGFFWICGGIYGNEAVVTSAPPAIVFICILIFTPIFYCTPVSMIVGELAAAMPYDGGYVRWVQEVCGSKVGGHTAYWSWAAYMVTAAPYPVLAFQYLSKVMDISWLASRLGATLLVVLLTIIKCAGLDFVVKFSGVIAVVSLLPTIPYCAIGFFHLTPSHWISMEGDIKITLLLSWTLWLFTGFVGLGTLAGQAKTPSRTLPITLILLLVTITIINNVPLAVSVSLEHDRSKFESGEFTVLAQKLGGEWLKWMFTVGANVSMVGLYMSSILTADYSLSLLILPHFPSLNYDPLAIKRSAIHRFMVSTEKTGVARIFILINAILVGAVVWLPFESIVELGVVLTAPSVILCMYVFVYLRLFRADMIRPFRIPVNKFGAVCIAILPVVITLTNAATSLFDPEPVAGVRFLRLYVVLIVGFIGTSVHVVHFFITRKFRLNSNLVNSSPYCESIPIFSKEESYGINKDTE